MQEQSRTYELETKPVGELLLKYSIPAVIGTLSVSLYNIVDRIFIGQGVHAYAISGLALTFPLMILFQAFGTLVGVGASARMSIALGMKNFDRAQKILGNAIVLTFLFWIILSTFGLLFLDEILLAFGGSENTLPYAKDYLRIVIPSSIFSNLAFSFSNIMRATGFPKKAMNAMLIGVSINAVLDPLFIFVFKMGIEGAAIATSISMLISAVYVMSHFFNKKNEIRFQRHTLKLNSEIVKNIVTIGMSPFLMNLVASGIVVILNKKLFQYGGDFAVGAYGIISSYTNFFVMIIIGVCQGMQPIVGYNYGAGKLERMKHTLKLAIRTGIIINSIGLILVLLIPNALVRVFSNDPELLNITKEGLFYIFLMLPLVGFQIVIANFFQSIGKASISIFMSICRQVLFLLPAVYICSELYGLLGVWLAAPISDFLSIVVAFFIYRWQSRILFKNEAL